MIHNFQIRILIYREDGEWVARALEMDLLGFGKTEREAVGELQRAVEAQISFAHQTNDSSLINFPAEPGFFKRWEVAQKKAMRSEILGYTTRAVTADLSAPSPARAPRRGWTRGASGSP